MTEEMQKWEYRVQAVGGFFKGVPADELEEWEVVSTHILENANKINVIAKRPLTREVIRRRSMPSW